MAPTSSYYLVLPENRFHGCHFHPAASRLTTPPIRPADEIWMESHAPLITGKSARYRWNLVMGRLGIQSYLAGIVGERK